MYSDDSGHRPYEDGVEQDLLDNNIHELVRPYEPIKILLYEVVQKPLAETLVYKHFE